MLNKIIAVCQSISSLNCDLVRSQLEFGAVLCMSICVVMEVQKKEVSGYQVRIDLLQLKSLEKRRRISSAMFTTGYHI